jgi:hypothetical protein
LPMPILRICSRRSRFAFGGEDRWGGQRDGSLATGDARVELGQKRATIVRGPAA